VRRINLDHGQISFLVYPDAEKAERWLADNAVAIGTDHGPLGGEDGMSYPSYVVTQGGSVSCIAVNGPVAVLGVMTSDAGNPVDLACALTLAGLAWVNTIQAGI